MRQPILQKFGKYGPLLVSTLRRERRSYDTGGETSASCSLFVSYNVHKCIGTDGRFDPDRVMAVIAETKADVVALQEASRRFGERAPLLDTEALRRRTGLRPVVLPGSGDGHMWRGNMLLIRQGGVATLRRLILPGGEPRGALLADLELPAGPVRVVTAHLGLLRRSRERQVRLLVRAARPPDGRPTLLMGDLNEWRLGRRSSLLGLEPHFGPVDAAIPSFPSRFPVWALDRILASPRHIVAGVEIHDTALARIASDHLPIKAAISFNASPDSDGNPGQLADYL
jgi:endonuclease/exonuclease/phosphatase family metal-dependent hydrolase